MDVNTTSDSFSAVILSLCFINYMSMLSLTELLLMLCYDIRRTVWSR